MQPPRRQQGQAFSTLDGRRNEKREAERHVRQGNQAADPVRNPTFSGACLKHRLTRQVAAAKDSFGFAFGMYRAYRYDICQDTHV